MAFHFCYDQVARIVRTQQDSFSLQLPRPSASRLACTQDTLSASCFSRFPTMDEERELFDLFVELEIGSYKQLKDDIVQIETSDSRYKCPFCVEDGKEYDSPVELLHHAYDLSNADLSKDSNLEEKAKHSALGRYIKSYYLAEPSPNVEQETKLVWPFMGVLANIKTELRGHTNVKEIDSELRDDYNLWDFVGRHLYFSGVELKTVDQALEELNQALIVKACVSDDECQEAREDAVNTTGSGNMSLSDLPSDVLVRILKLPIKSLISIMGVSKQWKNSHVSAAEPIGVWWIDSRSYREFWREGNECLCEIDLRKLDDRIIEDNPGICECLDDDDGFKCGLRFVSSCKGLLLYRYRRSFIVLSPFRQEVLITPAVEIPSDKECKYEIFGGIGVIDKTMKLVCVAILGHDEATIRNSAWVYSIGEDNEWRGIPCPDFFIQTSIRPVCDKGRHIYWVSSHAQFLSFDILEEKFTIKNSIPRGHLVDLGGLAGLADLGESFSRFLNLNVLTRGDNKIKIFKGGRRNDTGVITKWMEEYIVDLGRPLRIGSRKVLGVDQHKNIIVRNGGLMSYNPRNGILEAVNYPEWGVIKENTLICKGGMLPLCPNAHSFRLPGVLIPYQR